MIMVVADFEDRYVVTMCCDHLETICYDDACHLLRYAQNPKRKMLTSTTERLSKMEIVVDRFHFKNHVDSWCKTHCNPYKCRKLDQVSRSSFCITVSVL